MQPQRFFWSCLLQFLFVIPCIAQQLPQLWLNRFRPQGLCADRIAKLETDANGNVYVCGHIGGERATPDAFLMKRSPAGDTLWTYSYDANTFNDDFFYAMTVDASGNVYATGISHGSSNSFADCITVKLDSNGVLQWFNRYPSGTFNDTQGNDLAVDASGNVYVAGFFDAGTGPSDWLVIKYNSAGVQQWIDQMDGELGGDDAATAITIAPNGNLTVCGMRCDSVVNGGFNAFVRQYTPAGTVVWEDVYKHPTVNGLDRAFDLEYTASGELRVAATTVINTSSSVEMLGLAYDANGTRLWATIYSDAASLSAANENLFGADIDSAGNIFFCGSDFQGGFLTCIYSNGTMGWRKKWRGPVTPFRDNLIAVEAGANGSIYVAGKGIFPGPNYFGNGGIDNLIIAKYNVNGDSLMSYRIGDTNDISVGSDIALFGDRIYVGGLKCDTADQQQDHWITIIDTSLTLIDEWQYNGKGNGHVIQPIVRTDASDNVYVAATVDRSDNNGYDVVVVKYDAGGTEQWSRYFSSYAWNSDSLVAMETDPSGDMILCIATDSADTNTKKRIVLVRLNPSGDFIDTAGYVVAPGGSVVPSALQIRNDGLMAVSATSSQLGGLVLFYDAAFNLLWSARIDSSLTTSRCNVIAFFPNGDVAAGGSVQSGSITSAKGVLQRFNSTGSRLWTMDIDSLNVADEVRSIDISSTGDIAALTTSGNTTALSRVSGSSGVQSWRSTYNPGSTSNETGIKVKFTLAGNIAFICRGYNGVHYRYITVQYAGTGTLQWANVYSQTTLSREPEDILVDPQGRVVTGGFMGMGSTTSYDYVMVAYNSQGGLAWLNTWTSTSPNNQTLDYLRSLTRDASGNIIVTGESTNETINNDNYRAVTIKYGSSPVGLSEENNLVFQDNVYAYPNPSAEGLFSILDAANGSRIVEGMIVDMQGRPVSRYDAGNEIIDLRYQASGLYLFRYVRDNGIHGLIRLLKP